MENLFLGQAQDRYVLPAACSRWTASSRSLPHSKIRSSPRPAVAVTRRMRSAPTRQPRGRGNGSGCGAEEGSEFYALRPIDGHFVTAVDAGGRTTDTIHTDATSVASWELFKLDQTFRGYRRGIDFCGIRLADHEELLVTRSEAAATTVATRSTRTQQSRTRS